MLWVAVYARHAARAGIATTVLVPENHGVAVYLKRAGLFDHLRMHGTVPATPASTGMSSALT